MTKKIASGLDLKGKTVLVRADFSVPLKDGGITNDNRIVQTLPTIQYIIGQSGKIVLFSHLDKVKEESDRAKLTLRPVTEDLSKKLDKETVFVPETRGEKLEAAIRDLRKSDVLLVKDTRYEDLDGKKESGNDPGLGKYWASLGDVFINDTFGTAHHEHASNVGISTHLEAAAGLLMDKEIKFIGSVVNDPHKPAVAILSGMKVSDKINVIKNLVNVANKTIISGGMAYILLKAQGKEIGISLSEEDETDFAKGLLEKRGDKTVLSVGTKVAKEFPNDAKITVVPSDSIPTDQEGMDIGPNAVKLFANELGGAYTVVWNGPMSVFKFSNFVQGTVGVCKATANLKDVITTIDGGDSAAAAISLGFENNSTRISTGGEASLECLEGKELSGIKAINNK